MLTMRKVTITVHTRKVHVFVQWGVGSPSTTKPRGPADSSLTLIPTGPHS